MNKALFLYQKNNWEFIKTGHLGRSESLGVVFIYSEILGSWTCAWGIDNFQIVPILSLSQHIDILISARFTSSLHFHFPPQARHPWHLQLTLQAVGVKSMEWNQWQMGKNWWNWRRSSTSWYPKAERKVLHSSKGRVTIPQGCSVHYRYDQPQVVPCLRNWLNHLKTTESCLREMRHPNSKHVEADIKYHMKPRCNWNKSIEFDRGNTPF